MHSLVSTAWSILALAREKQLSFMAGSIAFFAFFSFIPALILAVAAGSLVGGDQFATQVLVLFETYLSEQGNTVLRSALTDPAGMVGASALGVLALFWSAIKVFRAIDIAFNTVYGVDEAPSLPRQLFHATLVVVVIGIGLVFMLLFLALLLRLDVPPFFSQRLTSAPVLVAGLILALFPLYYVLPPDRILLREAVPGTLTAACGLIVLQLAFQVYASLAGQFSTYGLLGAVLLFLLWLYFGAIVILVGTVINVVFAR